MKVSDRHQLPNINYHLSAADVDEDRVGGAGAVLAALPWREIFQRDEKPKAEFQINEMGSTELQHSGWK